MKTKNRKKPDHETLDAVTGLDLCLGYAVFPVIIVIINIILWFAQNLVNHDVNRWLISL